MTKSFIESLKPETISSVMAALQRAHKLSTDNIAQECEELRMHEITLNSLYGQTPKTLPDGTKQKLSKAIATISAAIKVKKTFLDSARMHTDNITEAIICIEESQSKSAKKYGFRNRDFGALIKAVRHAIYLNDAHMEIVKNNITKAEQQIEDHEQFIRYLSQTSPINSDAIDTLSKKIHHVRIELSMYNQHMDVYKKDVDNLEIALTLLRSMQKCAAEPARLPKAVFETRQLQK